MKILEMLQKTVEIIKELTTEKLLLIISHEDDEKYFEEYNLIMIE